MLALLGNDVCRMAKVQLYPKRHAVYSIRGLAGKDEESRKSAEDILLRLDSASVKRNFKRICAILLEGRHQCLVINPENTCECMAGNSSLSLVII
jgi:hypothetical protein